MLHNYYKTNTWHPFGNRHGNYTTVDRRNDQLSNHHLNYHSMKNYFINRDGMCFGPYSFDELRTTGVQPTDYIWTQGKLGWYLASSIKELKIIIANPDPIKVPLVNNLSSTDSIRK